MLSVTYEDKGDKVLPIQIYQTLFKNHYNTLHSIAEEVGASTQTLLQLANSPKSLLKKNKLLIAKQPLRFLKELFKIPYN